MKHCPSCHQDDGTDNKCCAFCGYPTSLPKESETRQWDTSMDTSPDGRMLESNPMYQVLLNAKKKVGI